MKKKFYFILLLVVLIAPAAFGQKSCDTLVLKTGQRIPAQIINSKQDGILYSRCGDQTGQQFFIEKKALDTILYPPTRISEPGNSDSNNLYLFNARKKNYANKTTVILWAGMSLADALRFDEEVESFSGFQFGGQVNFKNSPVQLGLMLRPLKYREDYFNAFEKNGPNGELTLILKKITIGRISGKVSKAYWGCDFQVGRRAYSHDGRNTVSPNPTKIKNTWFAVLPRIGYQASWDIFTMDIALPIGYRAIRERYDFTLTNHDDTAGRLSIQPAITLGIRF